jgi:ribosomal-protein-serine acetyltransferase
MEKSLPAETIHGDGIILRKHRVDEAALMFQRVDADRERLQRFLPWVPYIQSEKDELSYILNSRGSWDNFQKFDFGLFHEASQAYLGNIGAFDFCWSSRRCEIGYWILGEYEGQGWVTKAVAALEAELFRMGMHRIQMQCSTENLRSSAIPRRLGYSFEGTRRDFALVNGRFHDLEIYAKIKEQ